MEGAKELRRKVSASQQAGEVVRKGKEHGLGLLFQTNSEKNNLCGDGDRRRIHRPFRWRRVRAKVIPGL